jgi:DNA polymerase III delta subunit
LSDALFTLGKIRAKKENALKFLGLLAWQFRTIIHIRHCLDQNMPEQEICKIVAVFKDRFAWMATVARKKSMEFHTARLAKLLECDAAIKTLNTEPFTLIEKFIYQSALGIS